MLQSKKNDSSLIKLFKKIEEFFAEFFTKSQNLK